MTPRESDIEKIYGGSRRSGQLLLHDLDAISRGVRSSSTFWYGDRIERNPEENWYDSISSLMQSSHKTSMTSLNDDNRQDEKEIELLEQASSITDESLDRYKNYIDYLTQKQKDAQAIGDRDLADYYSIQAAEI